MENEDIPPLRSEDIPEKKALVVFKGTPVVFYIHEDVRTGEVMDDAVDYLNDQTEKTQEVHTMMMVDARLVPHSFVSEYVGVRRTTLEKYRKENPDD